MIEIKGLKKSYGEKAVLKEMSLTVQSGSVFGLVGINGAGKSTLLRILAGVLRADEGEATVDGKQIFDNEDVKKGIFFLPDDPFYTTHVSANGLAALYSSFYGFDQDTFEEYLVEFDLDAEKPIRNFSKGMRRQVFVALALACKPKLLLLDEAFDGLDPLARLVFKRGLIRLVDEVGTTVMISSHSLRELEDICDSYGILDGGLITSSGDLMDTLANVHKLQMAFEGEVSESDFTFLHTAYEKSGRVVKLIVKGDLTEAMKVINGLSPLFVEEIDVGFEELFVSEVQQRGYLR